jgi:hypothetical protein
MVVYYAARAAAAAKKATDVLSLFKKRQEGIYLFFKR